MRKTECYSCLKIVHLPLKNYWQYVERDQSYSAIMNNVPVIKDVHCEKCARRILERKEREFASPMFELLKV